MSGVRLTVAELRAGYGKAVVLQGLSLAVEPGEIVGVAGPNGAGKTTLLRALSGLIKRSSGSCELDGEPLPGDPARTCVLGVAHVPEGRRLLKNLTVDENLHVGARGAGVSDYSASRARVLEQLPGLESLLGRRAGVLSGGQQQLVAVGRGLVAEPRLLLLDELSLGLSPRAAKDVSAAAVAGCRERGASVLWVDQNVGLLAKHCDRLLMLRSGVAEALDAEREVDLSAVYF